MIDLSNIENYRENNRIEAKKALGGLPHSIWETYSSFANTLGGIILLGVEEYRDKTLHPVDLPDPEKLVREFLSIVTDGARVSANILSSNSIRTELAEGKRIIVIEVPRASRIYRPVYIGEDPFTGTYRRGGEGDYRCTREEVQSMLRDAEIKSRDMEVLKDISSESLDISTVESYFSSKGFAGAACSEFSSYKRGALSEIGAMERSEDGNFHPTAAGLLMFGKYKYIISRFKDFSPEYRDEREGSVLRVNGQDGMENLYSFFTEVCLRLRSAAPDEEVCSALYEALENSIVNADYCAGKCVLIVRRRGGFVFSNSGCFRLDIKSAESGGISDPRNYGLIKIFSRAGFGGGVGGGIPFIYSVWRKNGWARPQICESFAPERTTLVLSMRTQTRRKKLSSYTGWLTVDKVIINYLTDNISGNIAEISNSLGLKRSDVSRCISTLVSKGIVAFEGTGEDRRFRLKS